MKQPLLMRVPVSETVRGFGIGFIFVAAQQLVPIALWGKMSLLGIKSVLGIRSKSKIMCLYLTNVYNPRSFISRKNEYKETLVKKGATLGANSTIVCGVVIGEYSFVAASALVNADVKPFALVAGVPAIQIGWMSRFGEQLPLPIEGNGEARCPHTDDIYILKDGYLFLS